MIRTSCLIAFLLAMLAAAPGCDKPVHEAAATHAATCAR